MSGMKISRRRLLATSGAALRTPQLLRAQEPGQAPREYSNEPPVSRNSSSFVTQRWQDHFDTLGLGAIVADTTSRALHYWSADGQTYKVYPTSVPATEELTKRGYTEIVRKKEGPDWTPTASMMERFPHYKYMPPGPDLSLIHIGRCRRAI